MNASIAARNHLIVKLPNPAGHDHDATGGDDSAHVGHGHSEASTFSRGPANTFAAFSGRSRSHTHGRNTARSTGPGKSVKYDNTTWTLSKARTDLTDADYDRHLDKNFPQGWEVKGAKKGTPCERHLKNALGQLAGQGKARWGTETDILVPTGNGKPARVQITIDKKGKATAELQGYGKIKTTAKFDSIADAKAALKSDFKVGDIKNKGGASWSKAELEKVYDGFSKMSPAEKKALEGVDLVRQTTINGGRSGEFSYDQGVDRKGNVHRKEELRLADAAFNGDDKSFVGGKGNAAHGSANTIVHEAAHAVETKNMRDARGAHYEAIGAYNRTLTEYKKTKDPALKKQLSGLKKDINSTKREMKAHESRGRSKRANDFVKYAKKHKLEPLTDYAKANWPSEPGEFYAEAYALYKNDPEYLKQHQPKLFDYFTSNKHL